MSPRLPSIRHCTSQPLRFFGRQAELALLDRALGGGAPSVAALVGPGGQGKTAIVQHWLQRVAYRLHEIDGLFLWSFYRGKDSDLCLRELFAYAEGLDSPSEVSASYCVDRLLPRLRHERWALVLDGTEVVQHESGSWYGRFIHPELGRLLEELAAEPMPGVAVITSRFPLPTLAMRRHAQLLSLDTLDHDSGVGLLVSLGVRGDDRALRDAAESCGMHAKAVELLGTWLTRFQGGDAARQSQLPATADKEASPEERHVARVLTAFRQSLSAEQQDILALATAFRQPPTEARLREYLVSRPVRQLLHDTWRRPYAPFAERPGVWLAEQVQELVRLRLLERVGLGLKSAEPPAEADTTTDAGSGANAAQVIRSSWTNLQEDTVLDAHPLVRRGFENVLGAGHQSACVRAGFLRGRPDRRPPASLEEAREEVELFHAYCDAGLWNDADDTFAALDNPKHRFLAPAFERDLLLRFFPEGDWRRPPLWQGFGRWRSLAMCHEMLGQFDDALQIYRPEDAPLRGDALIALGRLQPLLDQSHVAHPWQSLWQAYRAHALCRAGRTAEALAEARTAVPMDIYEWVHIFECCLRLGRLDALDLGSLLYRAPLAREHLWSVLARRRLLAEWQRVTGTACDIDLGSEYRELLEQYDRAGLPVERVSVRLGYGRWLLAQQRRDEARTVAQAALGVCLRHGMKGLEEDVRTLVADSVRI